MGNSSGYMSKEQKKIASAIKTLERRKLSKAFDPHDPNSRPNPKQESIFADINKIQYRYVVAGNQCLPEGSLIITPDKGLVPIQDLKPGDWVYDESGKEIEVEKTFETGEQEVYDIKHNGIKWAASTANHVWLVQNRRTGEVSERKLTDINTDTFKIVRTKVKSPLGKVNEPHAYAIAAMLGDGCRSNNRMIMSCGDSEVPEKISKILNCEITTPSKDNDYGYYFKGNPHINHHDEWCYNLYAHEKRVDLNIIKTWDRKSLLEFVAGLIDTDGSVFTSDLKRDNHKKIKIYLGMQAKSVMEAFQYAVLALWQIPINIHQDCREGKYKNGPYYWTEVSAQSSVFRILQELSCYLAVPRYKFLESYNDLEQSALERDCISIKKSLPYTAKTYDIRVKSANSLYLTSTGLVTHNSGKSMTAGREVAWLLENTHPYFDRKEKWGDGPIRIIIAGQDLTMMESELWNSKVAPFLDLSKWRLKRQGASLKWAVNMETKDEVLFVSHADGSERNRKHLQGYVAHYIWLDEMPTDIRILEELQNRIQARQGFFLSTFTPKFKNDKIRRMVDSSEAPYSKKYTMSKFDNPLFKDRRDAEMSRLSTYSEAERNTILYGAWSTGDNAVYSFDYETMSVDKLPEHYNAGWRHVLSVDPALRSKAGYTLWAEDPSSGTWYLVDDKYIEGSETLDPVTLFNQIKQRSENYNIIRRITDTMPYFETTAAKAGIPFTPAFKANNRKPELIKKLQFALSSGKIKIGRWCTNFLEEIQSCSFKEDTDKIINPSRFHTLDCSQYFSDLIPAYDPGKAPMPRDQRIQQQFYSDLKKKQTMKEHQGKANQGKARTVKSVSRWSSGRNRGRVRNRKRGLKIG